MKNLYLFVIFFLISGCCTNNADPIFHYSVLKALDSGVLEGTMTAGELKKHGDHGLGTYNALDGEMVMVDQRIYRVKASGQIVEPDDGELIPYAIASFFKTEDTLRMEGEIDYPALMQYAGERLPSRNLFYAIRIKAGFDYIKCGGVEKQLRPYDRTLLEILAERPVYEAERISGTLVGFWCPEYIGDINTVGFHLHFLADDHSLGGHLMEFRAGSLNIEYDVKYKYNIVLPGTEEFRRAHFRSEEVNY